MIISASRVSNTVFEIRVQEKRAGNAIAAAPDRTNSLLGAVLMRASI